MKANVIKFLEGDHFKGEIEQMYENEITVSNKGKIIV